MSVAITSVSQFVTIITLTIKQKPSKMVIESKNGAKA
jgi:hypothetical protein